jgi:diacylglycerol O-acyltransferase
MSKLLPQLLHSDESSAGRKRESVPNNRFNHPLLADRVVGHVRLELQQLNKLQKKYDCTINDIALCVVAGGVRKFLNEHNELPTENLVTLMPIDVRREGKDGTMGNHITVAKVCLYTAIEDTKLRLKAISEHSSRGKKRSKRTDAHAMLILVDDIHPAVILWLGQWLISSGYLEDLPITARCLPAQVA